MKSIEKAHQVIEHTREAGRGRTRHGIVCACGKKISSTRGPSSLAARHTRHVEDEIEIARIRAELAEMHAEIERMA